MITRRTDSKLGLSYDRANPERAHPGFGKLPTTAGAQLWLGSPGLTAAPRQAPLQALGHGVPLAQPWHGQDLWHVPAAIHTNGDTDSVLRHLARSCMKKGLEECISLVAMTCTALVISVEGVKHL